MKFFLYSQAVDSTLPSPDHGGFRTDAVFGKWAEKPTTGPAIHLPLSDAEIVGKGGSRANYRHTGERAVGARCAGILADGLEQPCPARYESGMREPRRRLNKTNCRSRMDLRLRQKHDSQRDIENWWVKLPVKVEQLQLEVS